MELMRKASPLTADSEQLVRVANNFGNHPKAVSIVATSVSETFTWSSLDGSLDKCEARQEAQEWVNTAIQIALKHLSEDATKVSAPSVCFWKTRALS